MDTQTKTSEKSNTKLMELARWMATADDYKDVNLLKHMDAIPYKSSGSSYGACGIRIDGNPEFVNAVMARLTDLVDGENGSTRLELARHKVDGSGLGKEFNKCSHDAEVVYIRLHQRGGASSSMDIRPGAFGRFLRAKDKVSTYLNGLIGTYQFFGLPYKEAEERAKSQMARIMEHA
jgi:hypothetical protein